MRRGPSFLTFLIGAAFLLSPLRTASAAEPIRFGACDDLTKAYTFIIPQVAQAAADLADLRNMLGGIEGHPIEIILQDHGNEPQRGIECYERLKREGVMIFEILSSPVSRAVLPRAMKDGNVLIQALVGRSDAADGKVFEWIFPIGPTYWGQAANDIKYIKDKAGGDMKGVKIAFLYLDYAFGQEPIPILQKLQAIEGFDLKLFPYPLPGNEQSGAWTQIRRFQPDWIIHWGFSATHIVAIREMKRNGIPVDKFISVNWMNEVDINNIGPENATGIKRGTSIVGGDDHPLKKEIIAKLYDQGKGNGDIKLVRDSYYNVGLGVYSTMFEAARLAIRNEGWPLTSAKIKRGLESIREFDAGGFMAPLTITAEDHGGGGKTRIERWDGTKWVAETDWFAAYTDVVWEIIREHSAQFAKSGQ